MVTCPHCGRQLNRHTHVADASREPADGDATICYRCGGLFIYEITSDRMVLREPTANESERIENDLLVQAARRSRLENPHSIKAAVVAALKLIGKT